MNAAEDTVIKVIVAIGFLLIGTMSASEELPPSWPIPQIQPLNRAEYRGPRPFTRRNRVARGFVLESAFLLPSERWICAWLTESISTIDEPIITESRRVAIIAVNCASGSATVGRFDSTPAQDETFGVSRIFSAGENHCGITVERFLPDGDRGEPEQRLWIWDLAAAELLDRGEWRPLGDSDVVSDQRVASVLELQRPHGGSTVSVASRASGNRTSYVFQESYNGEAVFLMDDIRRQWLWPTECGALIVGESAEDIAGSNRIYAVAPDSLDGILWELTARQLEDAFEGKIDRLHPAASHRKSTTQIMLVAVMDPAVHVDSRVLVIDVSTGRYGHAIDLAKFPSIVPILSLDASIFVTEWSLDGVNDEYRARRLPGGEELGALNAPICANALPFAVSNDFTVFAAGSNTIWSFDIRKQWHPTLRFRLDKSDERD